MRVLLRCFVALLFLPLSTVSAKSGGLEGDILDELNLARTDPAAYAGKLERYRGTFDGNVAHPNGDPIGIRTKEGVVAVDEAIAFLRRQPALSPLKPSSVLDAAAGDHVADRGRRGAMGHVSVSGATAGQRAQRRGGGVYVSETISYGLNAAADVVRQLIVDDGVRHRGHRFVVFTSMLRYAGIACGEHTTYTFMCVIDYSATPDGRPPAAATMP